MRKALLTIPLLALACAQAAGASAAPRGVARAPIVCPGAGQFCCGPPTAVICCEPTILPCPSISISAAPDPSKARQSVRITGRVGTLTTPAATVTLWQALPGQSTFHSVAQTTADYAGQYAFTRLAMTNRLWYVSSGLVRSATVAQRVRADVTLSISVARSGAGEMVTLAGKVTPSHAGERIRLERRSTSNWVVFATAKLSRFSTFRVRMLFAAATTADVRAVLGGDLRNIKSYSPAVKTLL